MRGLTKLEFFVCIASAVWLGMDVYPDADPISFLGGLLVGGLAFVVFVITIIYIKNDGGISW